MYVRFVHEDYDASRGVLTLNAKPLPRDFQVELGLEPGSVSEDVGDTRSPMGIVNFATSIHPARGLCTVRLATGRQILNLAVPREPSPAGTFRNQPELLKVRRRTFLRTMPLLREDTRGPMIPAGSVLSVVSRIGISWYKVHSQTGQSGYVLAHPHYVAKGLRTPMADYRETERPRPFRESANEREAIEGAVVEAAEEHLGAPHIWGHDGSPGRPGFDAATFAAHVYRKVLGCRLPPVCRLLAAAGEPVPQESMRPGDLIVINNGAHAGICVPGDRMIQAGGGLGSVGYLSVAAGSYWNAQITSIKRFF